MCDVYVKGIKDRAAAIKFIVSHDFDMVKPTLHSGKKTMAPGKKRTLDLCKAKNFLLQTNDT